MMPPTFKNLFSFSQLFLRHNHQPGSQASLVETKLDKTSFQKIMVCFWIQKHVIFRYEKSKKTKLVLLWGVMKTSVKKDFDSVDSVDQ